MGELRAGGWVNRGDGKGWVLAGPSPSPKAPSQPEDTNQDDVWSDTADQPSDNEVREWARAEGLEVSSRGRVPSELVDRYKAAH